MYCTALYYCTQVLSLRATRLKTPCDRARAQDTDTDIAIAKFFLPPRLANGTKVKGKHSNNFKCAIAFAAGRAKLLASGKELKRAAQRQRQKAPMNERRRSQCQNRADAVHLARTRKQPQRAQRAAGSSQAARMAVENEESDDEAFGGEDGVAEVELQPASDEEDI